MLPVDDVGRREQNKLQNQKKYKLNGVKTQQVYVHCGAGPFSEGRVRESSLP